MQPDEARSPEALARAVLSGDRRAFAELALVLWPLADAAGRRLGRGGDHEDESQELFARILERLEANEHAALRSFESWKERHPEKSFDDWARIVLSNLAKDRRREHAGREARRELPDAAATLPSAKRLLNELAALEPLDGLAHRPPFTSAETAREILAYARQHLPPLQYDALAGWIEGESFEEVRARTSATTDEAATRLVRAAIAVLRRRFGE